MALSTVFAALTEECAALAAALANARWVVTEGKPAEGDSYLVGRLGDATLALIGEVKQVEAAAEVGRAATEYPTDVERARHALLECQRRFNAAAARVVAELLCYECIRDVVSARKGGAAWRRWSREVRKALGLCQQPVDGVRLALLACWQELAERVPGGVTVRATNIGQITPLQPRAARPAPRSGSASASAADGAAGSRSQRDASLATGAHD